MAGRKLVTHLVAHNRNCKVICISALVTAYATSFSSIGTHHAGLCNPTYVAAIARNGMSYIKAESADIKSDNIMAFTKYGASCRAIRERICGTVKPDECVVFGNEFKTNCQFLKCGFIDAVDQSNKLCHHLVL